MNMLTNRVQFQVLSKKEQELFQQAGRCSCECYLDGWHRCEGIVKPFVKKDTYRLFLEPGKYYYLSTNIQNPCSSILFNPRIEDGDIYAEEEWFVIDRESNISDFPVCDLKDAIVFRPATAEEIETIKPKVSYVDVEIDWEKEQIYYPEQQIPLSLLQVHKLLDVPHKGWIMVYYIHWRDLTEYLSSSIIWKDGSKALKSRATHIRFINLKRN